MKTRINEELEKIIVTQAAKTRKFRKKNFWEETMIVRRKE